MESSAERKISREIAVFTLVIRVSGSMNFHAKKTLIQTIEPSFWRVFVNNLAEEKQSFQRSRPRYPEAPDARDTPCSNPFMKTPGLLGLFKIVRIILITGSLHSQILTESLNRVYTSSSSILRVRKRINILHRSPSSTTS